MKKNNQIIITSLRGFVISLFALVVMTGHGQIKCNIEGEIMTDKYGDEVVICEFGIDLRLHDDPSFHLKAVNGKFSTTIECQHLSRYKVFLYQQYQEGQYYYGTFLAENGHVHIKLYPDRAGEVLSEGIEGKKRQVLDSILRKQYQEPIAAIDALMEDPERLSEYYNADFISTVTILNETDMSTMPQAYADSVAKVYEQFRNNPDREYTPKGLELEKRRKELVVGYQNYQYQYYAEHPTIWALYETLNACEQLHGAHRYTNFDPKSYERYLTLYHDKLETLYPDHPVHEQIATAEAAYYLQPGKPYIDYTVRNTDGSLVSISSLTKGKVTLVDLWASWCGPCRRHSKALIPVYEKYKDKGFAIVAIARERDRKDMEEAAKKDGYPWPSLLELNDENQVWRKNGAGNGGGAMFLIDRDGTILSTSTEASELEPIIKKALNVE